MLCRLFVPALYADRICAGENVSAFDLLQPSPVPQLLLFLVSVIPRGRDVVFRKSAPGQRDLH